MAKMFGRYTSTWAGDDKAIVTEADRMEVLKQAKTLKDTLRDLQKAKKPDVAKVAEAQRILTILREKLVAAANPEVLGRYSRRGVEVAKSRAESAVVQVAKADVKNGRSNSWPILPRTLRSSGGCRNLPWSWITVAPLPSTKWPRRPKTPWRVCPTSHAPKRSW